MSHARLLILDLALLVFASCAGQAESGGTRDTHSIGGEAPRSSPLCFYRDLIEGGGWQSVSRERWTQIVLGNFRRSTRRLYNCAGETTHWEPTDQGCDVHEPRLERPPRAVPVTESSVIVGRSDRLAVKPIWVITHRFSDGDGFGPVAVVERTAEGFAVRALGNLRLPSDRARLRIHDAMRSQLVVADGERCQRRDDLGGPPILRTEIEAGEEDALRCIRYAQVLQWRGDHLVPPTINDEERCLGPARFYLDREHRVHLANQWFRIFRLAASIEYRGSTIVVHEQVQVEDADPGNPDRPPRLFRTSEADRLIHVGRRDLRSRDTSLLERAIRANGSLQLPIRSLGDE